MIYNNKIWISDIDEVINVVPELDQLADNTVMITGAAGLVCSSIVDLLFRYNDTHKGKIQIVASGRSYERMRHRFGEMVNRDDFTFVDYDASKTDSHLAIHADYIIHGASNSSPAMILKEPVETMLSNFLGMKSLLDYANENRTKRILYISSSEVYGKKENSDPFHEGQYGYIDLQNPRNSYSIGKRAAETLCAAYADEYGVASVIVRPGHIYGPTASVYDNRVSSAWTHSVARGKDIVMKSDGSQIRSYCYCLDCASAILKVLTLGKNNHAYNISNSNSIISIKKMAEILAKSGNVQLILDSPTSEEKRGFNPMNNSSLDNRRLVELGWRGCFNAETGFDHTIKILREAI